MSKVITDITQTEGDLSDILFRRKYWNEKARHLLSGAKIIDVEYMSEKEVKESGWLNASVCMLVEQKGKRCWIYPMRDDEGNDGGALAFADGSNEILPVL